MHELSIAEDIVRCVTDVAKQHGVEKVASVLVELGPLSGVVEDSLQFCFPLALTGTPFVGMELKVIKVPLRIYCKKCTAESALEEIILECPCCQSVEVEVVAGKDLNIKSIEV